MMMIFIIQYSRNVSAAITVNNVMHSLVVAITSLVVGTLLSRETMVCAVFKAVTQAWARIMEIMGCPIVRILRGSVRIPARVDTDFDSVLPGKYRPVQYPNRLSGKYREI